MSESEDDYMSESILSGIPDVKPGLAKSAAQRRALLIQARAEESEAASRRRMTKAELEVHKREEALAKPVSTESKGFALLAKMGYKPGTTLGKEGSNAIAEPLPLPVKLGRKGVGHDVEEQSEAKEKIDQHIRAMKEAAAQQTELLHDYRKRKRVTVDTKQVIGDIMKMRKACQELDVTAGLELPTVSWHWPIYKDRTGEIHNEPAPFKRRQPGAEEEDEEDAKFIYANGKEAPGNERFDELAEEELTDRLFQFSLYLREKHLYCHWCGAKFDDADQLGEQCPGNSRDAHE